jgi:tRNA (guanine37-N1)-methyltransferase
MRLKKMTFLSIHPEFIKSYLNFGIFARAIKNKSLCVDVLNLRDYSSHPQAHIDDKPYGGGDGMVMSCEPIFKAIRSFDIKPYCILPSPVGRPWKQSSTTRLLEHEHILWICARFGGVDQRIIDNLVDEQISLGDYIISGGELASLCIADSLGRLIPKAVGNPESVREESFSPRLGGLLEYPQYTRPQIFEGHSVPSELVSGDHKKISAWKKTQTKEQTQKLRPDILAKNSSK